MELKTKNSRQFSTNSEGEIYVDLSFLRKSPMKKQEWSFHSHSCLVVLWLLEKSFTEEPNLQLSSQHTGQITALRSQLV